MRFIPPPEEFATYVPACHTEPTEFWHPRDREAGENWKRHKIAVEADIARARRFCRSCPIRYWCAYDALRDPAVSGVWAGIYVPINNRGGNRWQQRQSVRVHALNQLHHLAMLGGYRPQPVRVRKKKAA